MGILDVTALRNQAGAAAIGIAGLSRFRVNFFKQRGNIVATFSLLQSITTA